MGRRHARRPAVAVLEPVRQHHRRRRLPRRPALADRCAGCPSYAADSSVPAVGEAVTGHPIRIAETGGFGLAGAGLPYRDCLPRRRSGAGRSHSEGVRHVSWRSAGASPSASPHTARAGSNSRRERIERGGPVNGRHDMLPQVGDGLWPGQLAGKAP